MFVSLGSLHYLFPANKPHVAVGHGLPFNAPGASAVAAAGECQMDRL